MSGVFIYWDNSNIFHEAQRIADEGTAPPVPAIWFASTSTICCAWPAPIAR